MSVRRFFRWLKAVIKGYRLLVTYNVSQKDAKFDEGLEIAPISEAQAYAMGYVRGIKIKDELKYMPFKTYVRFIPDIPPLEVVCEVEGESVYNHETSSTLYDHWRSDALERFLAGMTTKKALTPLDQKKLIMIGLIVAGAALGIWLILM